MMREEEVERLRGVVRDCVSKHLYSSAIFFADKVAAATGDYADIYMQAQAFFLGRHYHRALHVLKSSPHVLLQDLRFRDLAAKCLEELKEWHQCLMMLGDAIVDEHGNVHAQTDNSAMYLDKDGEDHEINITAAICFLRGKAYEALENRAQAQLCKSTSLDETFAPAWIGSGNAHTALQEADQAMSAFRTAAHLFPGCHLPALYMGMECMQTHNFKLAEQVFLQAKAVCPFDPLFYNELGVVAYHMKEYQKAVQWFEMTLDHVASSLSDIWEPTLVNLAHAQRKLKITLMLQLPIITRFICEEAAFCSPRVCPSGLDMAE
ncbi:hypothetical protein COCNU_13G001190 [Cocos nucifera]|uniref:Uncharacterized protein n=1 Tax=Cocos nucifera TaxID=13894 RepID=A0A8K0NAX3_COCNU|nr:hypothetical protein COCNU_13G001190 [Cocos nucifera]